MLQVARTKNSTSYYNNLKKVLLQEVPDDSLCKIKHVAQYYVTLKFCVGLCDAVVCDTKNTKEYVTIN